MSSRSFGIMDALKFGFSSLWNNLWRIFLVFVGIFGALAAINVLFFLAGILLHLVGINLQLFTTPSNAGSYATTINLCSLLAFLFFLLLFIFTFISAINMAIDRIGLDAYDKKKTALKSLIPLLGVYMMGSALFYLLTFFGFFLLVIPCIFWFTKYNFVDLIVIDTGMGVIDAFKRSGKLTYGHKWYLLGEYVLMNLLFLLSIVTIIGPVVLLFVFAFSRVYIYRKLVESHNEDIAQFTAVPPNM
jgi:uncharacterized membrane protein